MRQEQQEYVQQTTSITRTILMKRGASLVGNRDGEPHQAGGALEGAGQDEVEEERGVQRFEASSQQQTAALSVVATDARQSQLASGEFGWVLYDGIVVALMMAAVALMVAYVLSVNSTDTPTTSRYILEGMFEWKLN